MDEKEVLHEQFIIEEHIRQRMKIRHITSFDIYLKSILFNLVKLFSNALDVPGVKHFLQKPSPNEFWAIWEQEKVWEELKKFGEGGGLKPAEIEKEFIQHWGRDNLFSRLLRN